MAEDPPIPIDNPGTQPEASGLSKLSLEIAQMVYGDLDTLDRMKLRKVSENLRQIVDNMPVTYQLLKIRAKDNCFIISYDSHQVEYRGTDNGCEVQLMDQKTTVFPGKDYVEVAKSDLETIFKNKRAHFINFEIDFQCEMVNILALRRITDLMQEVRKKNNSGFNVKNLNIEVNEIIDYFQIVDLMRCDTLEHIRTDIFSVATPLCVTLISDMDQWQNLKKLTMKCNNLVIDDIDAFARLEEIEGEFLVTEGEVQELINIFARNPNFKSCELKFPYPNVRKLAKSLNEEVLLWFVSHDRPIPGTNHFLQCRFCPWHTEIVRK